MMIELFAGQVEVQYGQFYLELDGTFDGDMEESFVGQENGLSGAQAPAVLFLITGLHTGPVGLTINLFESAPNTDESWDEVVEVSLKVPHGQVTLVEWAADDGTQMVVPRGEYRVRYSGQAMQEGNDINTNIEDAPIDRYRLDLWPAAPSPDQIIRQTSSVAAYWHDCDVDGPGGVSSFIESKVARKRCDLIGFAEPTQRLAGDEGGARRVVIFTRCRLLGLNG